MRKLHPLDERNRSAPPPPADGPIVDMRAEAKARKARVRSAEREARRSVPLWARLFLPGAAVLALFRGESARQRAEGRSAPAMILSVLAAVALYLLLFTLSNPTVGQVGDPDTGVTVLGLTVYEPKTYLQAVWDVLTRDGETP
ncbi:hypothetical protein [Jannaschia aquimarina]|uniref:Uncharacterized protein n=1 Tax=Jannaschia aquimarina TaxID=935700 RepID=A0A0D1EEA7_9RHOB|nr:hypothetical protein [Jannaschia aquimarina]KIT16034.1 hypothetical protein jaqu_23040 [Jannaschia aquimarina]SNT00603.1 hypothetical protein SAMN05421775_104215 [Jannaschia aquimarina]